MSTDTDTDTATVTATDIDVYAPAGMLVAQAALSGFTPDPRLGEYGAQSLARDITVEFAARSTTLTAAAYQHPELLPVRQSGQPAFQFTLMLRTPDGMVVLHEDPRPNVRVREKWSLTIVVPGRPACTTPLTFEWLPTAAMLGNALHRALRTALRPATGPAYL